MKTHLLLALSAVFLLASVASLGHRPVGLRYVDVPAPRPAAVEADHRVREDHAIRPRPHLTEGGLTSVKAVDRRQIELRFYAADGTFMRATFEQFLVADEGEEVAGVWVDK